MLRKCSINWFKLPVLFFFLVVIFQVGACVSAQGWPLTVILLISACLVAVVILVSIYAWLSITCFYFYYFISMY
jgi:hypothetical protein